MSGRKIRNVVANEKKICDLTDAVGAVKRKVKQHEREQQLLDGLCKRPLKLLTTTNNVRHFQINIVEFTACFLFWKCPYNSNSIHSNDKEKKETHVDVWNCTV